jgi:flagellar basal body P-ring protein FlgI
VRHVFVPWNGFDRVRLATMKMKTDPKRRVTTRNRIASTLVLLLVCGCSSMIPGQHKDDKTNKVEELLRIPDLPDLVREAGVSRGLESISIESVAAVNGLPGTGGPADPSPYRDQLIEEMKHFDIKEPNEFLELKETALVVVEGTVPAGARRGDPIDLRIRTPERSNVTDLHSGWLMDTRMRHQQVLKNAVRQSEVMAIGIGPVITRTDVYGGADATHKTEGYVVGGGRIQIDRKLGLILRPEYKHVKVSATLAKAINQRFYFFDGTTRRGVAKAIEDDYIEVEVHPRYRGQEARFMAIVGAIGVDADGKNGQTRLAELSNRLKEPTTAADAANQLEAIGDGAIPTLLEGLKSKNPELRFYAAEALAYLDRVESIEPLEAAIRSESAFRFSGLVALQGFEQHMALDALRRLLDDPSLETRYGAFRALRRRDDAKSILGGKTIGSSFRLYKLDSDSAPTVIVSTIEKPEILLLGKVNELKVSEFLFGTNGLLIKPEPTSPNQLRINRFQPGKEDQLVVVSNSVEQMITGIVAVGGGFGDVIDMLRKAKTSGYLQDQLTMDPLPKPFQIYYRNETDAKTDPTLRTAQNAGIGGSVK